MTIPALQSLFRAEVWDFETTSSCFQLLRKSSSVTPDDVAEDMSMQHFRDFLARVISKKTPYFHQCYSFNKSYFLSLGGEVALDSGLLSARMVYQFSTGSSIIPQGETRVVHVDFHPYQIIPLLPMAGTCARIVTIPLVFSANEMTAAWITAFNIEGGTDFTRR